MNQEQLDLIKEKVTSMCEPFRVLMESKECERIINLDGGQFMPIVISILASSLATCLNSFCSSVEDDTEEQNALFKTALTVVMTEALHGRDERLRKKNMH